MDAKTIQIDEVKRQLGTKYLELGVETLRECQTDFDAEVDEDSSRIVGAFGILGVRVTLNDTNYRFTDWGNWVKILPALADIAATFPWTSEVFDCDNRANLMSSLCSLIFLLNTMSVVYCRVYDAATGAFKYLHYCNLIADTAGNVYLFDADQGGMSQQIKENNVVMGVNRYELISVNSY